MSTSKIKKQKSRNLLAPEQKKRKGNGAKLGTGYEADMQVISVEDLGTDRTLM
jgi:hypothetical protein